MLSCLRPALKKRKRYSAEGPEFAGSPAVVGIRPASDAPPSSSKRVRILKGKRCEHSFGSADPDVDRTPIQLPYHCDGCGNYILTVRHNCGGCEDYDLCDACFRAYRADEPGAASHDHPADVFYVAEVDEGPGEAPADDATKTEHTGVSHERKGAAEGEANDGDPPPREMNRGTANETDDEAGDAGAPPRIREASPPASTE